MEKDKIAGSSCLQKTKQALLFLILFLTPTQLGHHFWPDSAFVYGVRVDYLAPTLSFLDLLIIVYLSLLKFRPPLILYSLFIILVSNFLFSTNPLATLSWSLHFLVFFSFVLSLTPTIIRNSIFVIRYSLFASALFQLILVISQVYLGHSIQGPLYYLGERLVSVGQPGVAVGTFMDNVVLRAYGTFSHPNTLAGWLVIASLIVLNLKPAPLIRYSLFVISGIGILLTQSRTAGLVFFGLVIPIYLLKSLRSRLTYYLIVAIFVIHYSLFTPPRSGLSLSERLDLQAVSLETIRNHLVFGTGAQASISTYPQVAPTHRLLQPDHNSFTLFVSWFGLFGVLALLYCFRSSFVFRISSFKLILPLLPLLLLDHYLLTSPQGLLVLLLYLRLSSHPAPTTPKAF